MAATELVELISFILNIFDKGGNTVLKSFLVWNFSSKVSEISEKSFRNDFKSLSLIERIWSLFYNLKDFYYPFKKVILSSLRMILFLNSQKDYYEYKLAVRNTY